MEPIEGPRDWEVCILCVGVCNLAFRPISSSVPDLDSDRHMSKTYITNKTIDPFFVLIDPISSPVKYLFEVPNDSRGIDKIALKNRHVRNCNGSWWSGLIHNGNGGH